MGAGINARAARTGAYRIPGRALATEGDGQDMGISTSIIVFAIGAIMRFAVTATATGFNVHTVGDILMIVGAVGLVISLIFWSSWGGFGGRGRGRTMVTQQEYGTGAVAPRTYVTRTQQDEVV
jgi:hypothetical protein